LTDAPVHAAIDLGASSGRVVCGRLDGDRVVLEECARFANRPLRLPDGLRWNLLHLFAEALDGLRRAGREGRLAGVGVDTWGVDYALLDDAGRVLGLPFHYRDARTDGMIERALERVPADDLYAVTGIQTMPINTVFQLLADEGSAALDDAAAIALVPDLLAHWLCGRVANERTNASTTGLLDARTGEWAHDLIGRLGLPQRLFGDDDLVEPGTELGRLLGHHELGDAPVYAVASHDTASAYVAAPLRDEHDAILSSGTWSLLGVELPEPVLGDAAREANLTNERGVDGTTRLLKNVMGLWLEQECARVWDVGFPELHRLAEEAPDGGPLFDPDDDRFLAGGDVPGLVEEACRRTGQPAPGSRGAIVRAIHTSLACKYRLVLERLEAVTGREIRRLHVIGGGAQNRLLTRLTADVTGREVLVGAVEATALGNVLVQLRAAGEIASLDEMRALAAASAETAVDEPAPDRAAADETYARFLEVTGLETRTTA
jgi:rhamnulokinase